MKHLIKPLVLALSLSTLSISTWAASITAVRSWRAPDNTRLVLDLSEKTSYRQISGQNKQIIIELDNTDTSVSTLNLPNRVGLIQNVLLEKNGDKQRLIINLSDEVRPHIFMLPANEKFSARLVIDLFDKVLLQAVSPEPEPVDELVTDNKGRAVIVVVDAGHGGEDSGAIGATGNYEKHVTLAIAKKLVALLRKEKGFKAYLTRDDDYFIPLQDRRKIARNRYKADIFISIHADAALSPLAKGASVFALSRKGANSATSRFAQALADRENKSDLLGGVDNSFGKDLQLNNILADMVVEGTVTQSLHMGSYILKEMDDLTKLHSKRVEQAGFAVLKEAGMISLLVETGFMTNVEEEAKLIQSSYQQQMAEAVFVGLRRFVQKYPIPQTYFAVGKEQKNRNIRDRALQEIAPPAPKPINNQPEKLLDKPIDNKAIINSFNQEVEPTKNKPVDDKVVKQPEKTAESKPMVKATLPSSLDEFMAGSMTTTTPVAKEVKPEKPVVKANVKPTFHVVEKGDTLSAIAVRYQLSIDDLKTWNQLKNDNALLGQRLRLTAPDNLPSKKEENKKASSQETSVKTTPVNKTEKVEPKVAAKDKSENTLADKKTSIEKDAKTKEPTVKTHKVKVGDSLSSIATKYGVSAQAIKDLNKLKDDNVVLDKTLKIPTP